MKEKEKTLTRFQQWVEVLQINVSPKQWEHIFLNLIKRNTNNKAFEIKWKVLHRGIPTLQKVAQWKGISPYCKRCKKESVEDEKHWFFDCPMNKHLLIHLFKTLAIFLPDIYRHKDKWALILLGLEHFGYKNVSTPNRIVDIYFEVVYFSRMKLTSSGEIDDLRGKFAKRLIAELTYVKNIKFHSNWDLGYSPLKRVLI